MCLLFADDLQFFSVADTESISVKQLNIFGGVDSVDTTTGEILSHTDE